MKKQEKNNRIELRLTEKEVSMFNKKAKQYQSLSKLIIDAVTCFNERGGINFLNTLEGLEKTSNVLRIEITHLLNNVNQIEVCLKDAEVSSFSLLLDIISFIEGLRKIINNFFRVQDKYFKKVFNYSDANDIFNSTTNNIVNNVIAWQSEFNVTKSVINSFGKKVNVMAKLCNEINKCNHLFSEEFCKNILILMSNAKKMFEDILKRQKYFCDKLIIYRNI